MGSMRTTLIPALGGGLQTLVQMVGGPLFQHWLDSPVKWRRLVLGVLSFVLGTLLVFAGMLAAPPPESTPPVRIISPSSGSPVAENVVIKGTSQGLDKRHKIWIAVISLSTARFYPQNGPVSVRPDGQWTSLPTYIGIRGDDRKDVEAIFDIVALVVTKEAHSSLSEYLAGSNKTGRFLGLGELPEGAIEYDRVTVFVGSRQVPQTQ